MFRLALLATALLCSQVHADHAPGHLTHTDRCLDFDAPGFAFCFPARIAASERVTYRTYWELLNQQGIGESERRRVIAVCWAPAELVAKPAIAKLVIKCFEMETGKKVRR